MAVLSEKLAIGLLYENRAKSQKLLSCRREKM